MRVHLLSLSLLLVALHVLTVSAVYVPVGFHGTDNNAKYSMLKGIKTQKDVGNKESQILGTGTYFGIVPTIANWYAQTRCNQRKIKPSQNAAVVVIGVEDKYALHDLDLTKTYIKSTDAKAYSPFFAAVNKLVTTCKKLEDEALKKNPKTSFKCNEKPDVFDFQPERCPSAEFVVLDDKVVSIPNQVVALGYYNVYEINAKAAPQKGAYLIEQYKTKYWFYPNINIITSEFKEEQIFERVRQFIQVSSTVCSSDKSWTLKVIPDAADAVLTETDAADTHTHVARSTDNFSRARLKSLQTRTNHALQP